MQLLQVRSKNLSFPTVVKKEPPQNRNSLSQSQCARRNTTDILVVGLFASHKNTFMQQQLPSFTRWRQQCSLSTTGALKSQRLHESQRSVVTLSPSLVRDKLPSLWWCNLSLGVQGRQRNHQQQGPHSPFPHTTPATVYTHQTWLLSRPR